MMPLARITSLGLGVELPSSKKNDCWRATKWQGGIGGPGNGGSFPEHDNSTAMIVPVMSSRMVNAAMTAAYTA